MVVRARERRELQEALLQTLGPGPADAMMDYLPPVGWSDVATKQDLIHQTAPLATKADLAVLASRVDGLATKVEGLAGKVEGLTGKVEGLTGKVEGLTTKEAVAVMISQLQRDMKVQFFWTLTLIVALFGIVKFA